MGGRQHGSVNPVLVGGRGLIMGMMVSVGTTTMSVTTDIILVLLLLLLALLVIIPGYNGSVLLTHSNALTLSKARVRIAMCYTTTR